MVAYSYKERFIKPIEALIKVQTMRNDRARHARAGEEIQNYYAMRTKQCRLIGRALCTAVTPVRLDFIRFTVEIEGRNTIKRSGALDAFALRDGFSTWESLMDFWAGDRKKDEPSPERWSGVLIEWQDFKLP